MSEATQKQKNSKLVKQLLGVVAGMSLFVVALVPLYNVFCDITGLNGKTRGKALYAAAHVDSKRTVTVEFITNINRGMPWEFRPMVNTIEVHPGELNEVHFYAKNLSKFNIVGQSVPSVAPGQAALYLNKTECFCFDKQRLAAGEAVEMPMKFYIDADIPKDIDRLTLSYQLFNVTDSEQSNANESSVATK